MANPQCEDGYTRLANELFVVALKLEHVEWKIFGGVVRLTYGYNRKEAEISVSQLAELCAMSERRVFSTLARLVARRVLYVRKNGPRPMTIGIEKDYEQWEGRPATSGKSLDKRPATSGKSRPATSGKSKASYHIDERHKKKTVPRTPSEEALRVARSYHERIRTMYPTLTRSLGEKADIEGAMVLDDLVRIDGHDWEEVKNVLRWALTDAFWSKNLRSLAGARKKASGSGGATKFENCAAKKLEVSEIVRGALPRPPVVTRFLTEEEERAVPNSLGFMNSPNGKEEGKNGQGLGKVG